MFEAMGRTIRISRGDTGLLTFSVQGIGLTDADRAVFTIRRKNGGILMEKTIEPQENCIRIPFTNEETERMPAGRYAWDIRFALDAQLDGNGRVNSGREVLTPFLPGVFCVEKVVGCV